MKKRIIGTLLTALLLTGCTADQVGPTKPPAPDQTPSPPKEEKPAH